MSEKKYSIRKSKLEDMHAVQAAHRRSIRKVCAKDYSEEQIRRWSAIKYSDDRWTRNVTDPNQYHLVVEVDRNIEGFCHGNIHDDGSGQILGLFLAPKAIGLGAAKEAFSLTIDLLRRHSPPRIILQSTKTAKGFYERLGLKAIGPEFQASVRGTHIECYGMEMNL